MYIFYRYCYITILAFILSVFAANTFACTGIQLMSKDGAAINGRTAEFGIQLHPTLLIVPRNYAFSGTLPDGSNGMSYQAKYGAVGVSLGGNAIMDGLNEAGLSAAAFYLPGYAKYAEVTSQDKGHAVAPMEFVNWLLTQFASVDEVKKGLQGVTIVPTVFKTWGFVPPFHFIVYDKTGKSIVIEPINGKLVVYDDPIGVITNSPTFDWQMTNLQNYINLSPVNVDEVAVKGMTLKAFGEGSGMRGLPGDFTPPSRFVRAAIFSSTELPSQTADQTVFQVFHILNQFDIPVGAVRTDANGVIHTDYTQVTSVKDPKNLRYYYRTYDDQNINVVNIKSCDLNAKAIKTVAMDDQQTVNDVTASAK